VLTNCSREPPPGESRAIRATPVSGMANSRHNWGIFVKKEPRHGSRRAGLWTSSS